MPHRFERELAEKTLKRKVEKVMPSTYSTQTEAIIDKMNKVLDATEFIKDKIIPVLDKYGLLAGLRINHMNFARKLYRYFIMYRCTEAFDTASKSQLIAGLGNPDLIPEITVRIVNLFREECGMPVLKLEDYRDVIARRPPRPWYEVATRGL